jgi:hypothetical protein
VTATPVDSRTRPSVNPVASLPDRRGGKADQRVGAERVGPRPHPGHRIGQALDRLLGQKHGREGGLGKAQGLALAGDRHKGPVGLAVNHHQVDGVRADIQDGQAQRLGLPGEVATQRATSLPQEGSGLQAGGELWSWGRRCCSM